MNSSMTEQAFFEAPMWSAEYAHLHQAIGGGRQSEAEGLSLQLTKRAQNFNHERRTMLPLELSLDGQAVRLWFDEAALLEWLEPILPAPDLSSLNDGLREAALAWTLAPWLDWCVQHRLTPPSIKALGALASPPERLDQPDIILTFIAQDDHRWLDLHLDGFPLTWLSALAKCMAASPDQHAEQHTVISACAGFAHLSVTQLAALQVGDVVMAAWQAPLKNGSLLLVLDRLLVQIGRLDENHFEIERVMEPLGEENHFIADTTEPIADEAGFTQETQPADEAAFTPEAQPAAELDLTAGNIAASLPMTLVFEIGQMTVPLSALSQLKEGDVLAADFKTAPEIGIRTQGRLIATASLVRIGERLGAKITRLIAPDETR
ncbi:FliM/FliN family flagellar motor switch protein [Mycoavidus sp. SF9855]|uniref:FliM/FliN family flagellar motor switch protein n=1 Tax=Mycoavidus sp. SF9855 TaxID=2968475 RepID=UPI00211BB123|nr:FliM/FliN family flagellar motor switch protein [Mycoavidus sp. SF9855]UUM21715.1 FliM/FliN family flagellar motor switch protein [Mycoavidus sp. SF9855]